MSEPTQLSVYRPLNFSQILERIYRLLREDFRTQFGIALVPGAAIFITYGAFFALFGFTVVADVLRGNQQPAMPSFVAISVGFLAFLFVHLCVMGLYLAAASYAAVNVDCERRANVRESYAIAWKRAGHFVGLILSMYAVCFLPALVLEAAIGGAMAGLASSKELSPVLILLVPLGVLLVFAALIGGVVIAIRLSLAFPASVFEALSVRESMKRNWALTRGAAGRIFLVVLVVYVVLYVVMMIAMMAVMFVGAIGFLVFSGASAHAGTHTIWTLAICGGALYLGMISVFSACSWMGFSASFAVIYNDQRLRMPLLNIAPAGAKG